MKSFLQKVVLCIFLSTILMGSASHYAFAQYPQLDISGYKNYQYSKIEVSPFSNYTLARTYLGPSTIQVGDAPWREKLQLKILGQLSRDLSVSYNLSQEPDIPEKYDVNVTYGSHKLTFGDFTASIAGNEFAATNKFVNGFMFNSTENWYDFSFVSAKLKSNQQPWTTQNGRNTRGPYNLGHGSIVEGSETILINDEPQVRDKDYIINYFDGNVTFSNNLGPAALIKYTYEYTKIIDLFFPTVSKRDFIGTQARFTVSEKTLTPIFEAPKIIEYKTGFEEEIFPATAEGTSLMEEVQDYELDTSFKVEEKEESEEGWGMVGVYRLKHQPIIPFSETVEFMGIPLRKDQDYSLDYQTSTLTLLTPQLPTPAFPLKISYKFYETSQAEETISGIGSRGPYTLTRENLVEESEKVYVDNQLKIRNLEYTIDYRSGKIIFTTVVPMASEIKVIYQAKAVVAPTAAAGPPPAAGLTVGTTYLRETARQGSGAVTATVIENFPRNTIVQNNNIINLTYYPLDETTTVSVKINNTATTEGVGYAIPTREASGKLTPNVKLPFINHSEDSSNGYKTGTLAILSSLEATDEVTVTYTYKKSILKQFSGSGNNNQGPYYLVNFRNIVVGSEIVQVWEAGTTNIVTYTRNSSPELWDGKYSINYTDPQPYILFNTPLLSSYNFLVKFYAVPEETSTVSNLNHDVLGLDTNFKLGGNLNLNAAYARSRTDQAVVPVDDDTLGKIGSNSRGPYKLDDNPIVIEGSEKVYVNKILKNRDIDYFINYTGGQITFYNLTLTPSDTLDVYYQRQDISGVGAATTVREGSAYKVAATGNLVGLKLSGDYKKTEAKFSPIETTALGVGGEYKGWGALYEPSSDFSLSYSDKLTRTQLQQYENLFLNTRDQVVDSKLKFFGLATAGLNLKRYETLDDLLPSKDKHDNDNLSDTITGNVNFSTWRFGPLTYTNTNNFSRTTSTSDTFEKLVIDDSRRDFLRTSHTLDLTQNIKLGQDYQFSENRTNRTLKDSSGTNVTYEAVQSLVVAKDTTWDLNWNLTFAPIQRLNARAKRILHLQNDPLRKQEIQTSNDNYNLDFTPISQVVTNLDHNRTEDLTALVGGKNPYTEKTGYDVKFTPYNNFNLGWKNQANYALQESGNWVQGRSLSTSVGYNPFSALGINTTFGAQDRFSLTMSGTTESSRTNSYLIDRLVSVNYTPWSALNLIGKYAEQLDYLNTLTTAGPTLRDTTSNTKGLDINYKPYANLTFTAGLNLADTNTLAGTAETSAAQSLTSSAGLATKLWDFDLTARYDFKRTLNKLKQTETPKSNLKTLVKYPFFGWGNLSWDYDFERNQGEVRRGVVEGLDTTRTIHTISLDTSIPQNNPILSSVVLKASIKEVDYKDNQTAQNTFLARMITFEGSLNF